MYRLIALSLLCLLVIVPLHAQDNDPYQIALQRTREAAETNATELDLDYLHLTALPPEIGQLHNLEYLYVHDAISTNGLTSIPPEIGQLTNLVELWLSGQDLETLPPEIGNLANLEVLVLNFNNFTELPPEIGQLHNLRGLAVSSN